MAEKTYNGWKNYETWNVALWIGNDYATYTRAVNFMKRYKGRAPYRDFIHERAYVLKMRTPDGVRWNEASLDYRALNAMMRELKENA